jgi:hypothetical protein
MKISREHKEIRMHAQKWEGSNNYVFIHETNLFLGPSPLVPNTEHTVALSLTYELG